MSERHENPVNSRSSHGFYDHHQIRTIFVANLVITGSPTTPPGHLMPEPSRYGDL